MGHRLQEKVNRYEQLLDDAIDESSIHSGGNADQRALAADHIEMAEAYLADGRHFASEGDFINALAAYSYGHGWLDAAIRAGFVVPPEEQPVDGPRGV